MKRYATYALCLPLTAALLAACGGGGTTTTGPAPTGPAGTSITTVNGTVAKWTGGASTVELLAQPTAKSATNPALTSATLNANGTFALTLPSLATITPYLSTAGTAGSSVSSGGPGCTGTLTNSDSTEQDYGFSSLKAGNTTVNTTNVVITNSAPTAPTKATVSSKLWLYSTKPTTFSGSVTCVDTSSGGTSTSTLSFNAALIQGWNILALDGSVVISASGTTATTTINITRSTDAPSTWYLVPVSAQSLQAQSAAARFASAQATFGKLLGGHFGF